MACLLGHCERRPDAFILHIRPNRSLSGKHNTPKLLAVCHGTITCPPPVTTASDAYTTRAAFRTLVLISPYLPALLRPIMFFSLYRESFLLNRFVANEEGDLESDLCTEGRIIYNAAIATRVEPSAQSSSSSLPSSLAHSFPLFVFVVRDTTQSFTRLPLGVGRRGSGSLYNKSFNTAAR